MKKLLFPLLLLLTTSLFCHDIINVESQLTMHDVTINNKRIYYKAIAGTIDLPSNTQETKNKIFFTSYTQKNEKNLSQRPITFLYNGGPGSSSAWLHLGAFGPKTYQPNTATLKDNPETLLEVSDLVFIDPIGTGYSSSTNDDIPYYEVQKDIQSLGDFIRLYINFYNRWTSPKYIIGESYGGLRTAGLATYLQKDLGIFLNGLIFVSPLIDFQNILGSNHNDLPYTLLLPSLAATAWHYKKLPPPLQEKNLELLLDEVKNFASHDYLNALFQGDSLSLDKKENIINQLSSYTGLSKNTISNHYIRINSKDFVAKFLKKDKKHLAIFDTRTSNYFINASEYSNQGLFSGIAQINTIMNDYLQNELQVSPRSTPYKILNFEANDLWDYTTGSNRYISFADSLQKGLLLNPKLKILITHGYFDLATPYSISEYTLNHMHCDSLKKNISIKYYESGHMIYYDNKARGPFTEDIKEMYKN